MTNFSFLIIPTRSVLYNYQLSHVKRLFVETFGWHKNAFDVVNISYTDGSYVIGVDIPTDINLEEAETLIETHFRCQSNIDGRRR